jgi:hypothetical protein
MGPGVVLRERPSACPPCHDAAMPHLIIFLLFCLLGLAVSCALL